jgi:hypothetical protein
MLEFCATDSLSSDDSEDDLMLLSNKTQSSSATTPTIHLPCQLAGHSVMLSLLLDLGSSHSFISERLAPHLPKLQALPR